MSLSLCLSLCLGLGKVPDWGSYFSTAGDSVIQSPSPEVSCSLTEPVICHCGEEDMGLQDWTLSPSVWLRQPRVKLTQERPKAWLTEQVLRSLGPGLTVCDLTVCGFMGAGAFQKGQSFGCRARATRFGPRPGHICSGLREIDGVLVLPACSPSSWPPVAQGTRPGHWASRGHSDHP